MEYLKSQQQRRKNYTEINVKRKTDDVFAYFVPRMSLYLREFELSVVWIHAFDFLPSWCSKNL